MGSLNPRMQWGWFELENIEFPKHRLIFSFIRSRAQKKGQKKGQKVPFAIPYCLEQLHRPNMHQYFEIKVVSTHGYDLGMIFMPDNRPR